MAIKYRQVPVERDEWQLSATRDVTNYHHKYAGRL